MTLGQLNSLLARVAEAQAPEYRDRAWNAIVDEFVKRSEWIDPQRIVELAKRYTDEGNPGRVDIAFIDSDPDMCSVWSVDTRSIGVSGSNLSEVLRAAEES